VGISRDGPNFSVPRIISGTCKATNFKFGRYIQSVHANKRPLKIWEKRVRGRAHGLPKFLQYPYYLTNVWSYEVQIWQVYSRGSVYLTSLTTSLFEVPTFSLH